MPWRRLADIVMHRPVPPHDERSITNGRLDELAREVPKVNAEIHALAKGAEGRLVSYLRAERFSDDYRKAEAVTVRRDQ